MTVEVCGTRTMPKTASFGFISLWIRVPMSESIAANPDIAPQNDPTNFVNTMASFPVSGLVVRNRWTAKANATSKQDVKFAREVEEIYPPKTTPLIANSIPVSVSRDRSVAE